MEQIKFMLENPRDKYFPQILECKNSGAITANLKALKGRFPSTADYSTFLAYLIYVAAVPREKRINPDTDNLSLLIASKDGGCSNFGAAGMVELEKFQKPDRPGYLADLIEGMVVGCDSKVTASIFHIFFSLKDCEPVLRVLLEKTSIELGSSEVDCLLARAGRGKPELFKMFDEASYPSVREDVAMMLTLFPQQQNQAVGGYLIRHHGISILSNAILFENLDILKFLLSRPQLFSECKDEKETKRKLMAEFLSGSGSDLPEELLLYEWTKGLKKPNFKKREDMLVLLLLNGFPLLESLAPTVLKDLNPRTNHAIEVYINRADLRKWFSDEKKALGEAELDKRRVLVEPHIAVEAVMQGIVSTYI